MWVPIVRNLSLLEKSFFRERFNTKYVDMIEKCGVRLAVTHTMIKYLGFMLSNPSIVSLDLSKPPPQKNVRGRVKFQDWRVRLSTYAGGPKSCKWSGSWIMVSSNSWARLSTSRHPTTNPCCGCPATGTFILYHWRLQTSPTKTSRVGPGSWRLEGVREENLFAT